MLLHTIITIAQITISTVVTALILLQERDSGSGGLFGGGGAGSGFYQTRRGLEKIIFFATIVAVIVFAGLALANIFIA